MLFGEIHEESILDAGHPDGKHAAGHQCGAGSPPPTGPERRIPVKVTVRFADDGTQQTFPDCLIFNPMGIAGVLYALGDEMTWNYAKLGLDKGRFQAVGEYGMLYGKFPETKTSGEAPGTPKIEGIDNQGNTVILEPKAGFCTL
jgi:hypothetical protein